MSSCGIFPGVFKKTCQFPATLGNGPPATAIEEKNTRNTQVVLVYELLLFNIFRKFIKTDQPENSRFHTIA
jgi:hypothetical protein